MSRFFLELATVTLVVIADGSWIEQALHHPCTQFTSEFQAVVNIRLDVEASTCLAAVGLCHAVDLVLVDVQQVLLFLVATADIVELGVELRRVRGGCFHPGIVKHFIDVQS